MAAPTQPTPAPSYLATSTGLKSWLCTDDHKRVAVIYLLGIASATVVGGLLAIILRLEALGSGATLIDPVTHSRLFTMHGLVMVFAVVIPAIPAVLGNFILPLQLGAPGLALPRLNLLALYLWVAGTLLLLVGFALGGADTGWTLTTPYSIETPTLVLPVLIALALFAASALLTAINFLVTIHYLRAADLGWMQLPLSVWSLYVFAVVQLVTAPVLIAAMALLLAERTLGIGYFDPTLGGNPTLFSQMFWFYAHPATFASVVTAAGVVSEILTTFARRPRFAYRYLVGAIIALGGLGLVSWGRHLAIPGQSRLAAMVFSALALAIVIPATLLICNWLATLYRGALHLSAAMIYALAFVVLFAVAIATGLFLSALATAEPLHNTLLATAHFHYLMVGGTMVGFVAGLHYWWPKIFGRTYSEPHARVGAVLVFVALNLTLVPQLIMGARGTLRHAFDYAPAIETLQMLSTVGAIALALASTLAVLTLVVSACKGSPAPANPWGGSTREWETSSPPPLANFATPPCPHPLSSSSRHGAARLATWLLVIAEAALFIGVMLSLWQLRADRPELFAYGHRYLDLGRGVLATVVLIASSVAAAWAVRAAAAAHRRALVISLALVVLGAILFSGLTLVEYSQRADAGTLWGVKFAAGASPDQLPPRHAGLFFAHYFTTTALHLVHVIIAIALFLWLIIRARRGQLGPESCATVANVARFWQVIVAIWLYAFWLFYLSA